MSNNKAGKGMFDYLALIEVSGYSLMDIYILLLAFFVPLVANVIAFTSYGKITSMSMPEIALS